MMIFLKVLGESLDFRTCWGIIMRGTKCFSTLKKRGAEMDGENTTSFRSFRTFLSLLISLISLM